MKHLIRKNNGSLLSSTFKVAEYKVSLFPQLQAQHRRYCHFVAWIQTIVQKGEISSPKTNVSLFPPTFKVAENKVYLFPQLEN